MSTLAVLKAERARVVEAIENTRYRIMSLDTRLEERVDEQAALIHERSRLDLQIEQLEARA